MRIMFKPSVDFGEYHGWYGGEPLNFAAGQERDIPDEKARQLVADFPQNFLPVEADEHTPIARAIDAAPVDRMMRRAKTKRK